MVEKIKQALERAHRERTSLLGGERPTPEDTVASISAPTPEESATRLKFITPESGLSAVDGEAPARDGPLSPKLSESTTDLLGGAPLYEINTRRLSSRRVITFDDSHPAIESYRLLRTQLLQQHGSDKVASIGITSPNADEGKTLTSVNLAISLARSSGPRVVLMDADISNPSAHALFGMRVDKGLIDFLGGDTPLEDLLLRLNIPNLWFIPGRIVRESLVERTGLSNIDRLIASLTMDERNILIVDLPPVLAKDDTLALATRLDGVVMVVEEGATRSAEISRSVDLLRQCNLLGTVFNKFSRKQASYY